MNPRRWRCALIGCGFFAPNQIHAWRAIPSVDLIAVCDRDMKRAQATGSAYGIRAVYDDAATMLEREPVDFIDIVTTVEAHRSLVQLGARYGKAVICQKPLAATVEDADAMVATCREAHVMLFVHENFRWQRPFMELASRIHSGAIGRPESLRLTFHHAYDIYRDQPYLAKVERLALMDVGLHLFDVARVLLGEVKSLQCHTQRLNPSIRGEDCFNASLWHASGAVSQVDCSFFSQANFDLFPQTLALVKGAVGSLELAPNYRLTERSADSVREADVEPAVPTWGAKPWHCIQDSVLNFQRHVIDALEGRMEPQPSGAHNRGTLALALAAYDSAAQNRVIDVSDRLGVQDRDGR